jgi:hypothetical protein
MAEKSRRRLAVGALVVLAVAIFGAGINWGLPSHDIDPLLFGSGPDSAANALNSYNLTGVGINRLAGDWDENSNLPADVAAHPITDRSKPITLLDNRRGDTEQQIIQQGDETMARLSSAADAADKKYDTLRFSGNDEETDAARQASLEAQKKVTEYIADYNRRTFGDLTDVIHNDDVARARIIRRYRLYSYQPDEMISFRALAKMHPAKFQFDPMLYQYGGLWIYPLGAITKIASIFGIVTVSSDPTLYLDSPQDFGRFYVLARAYSAVWGIVAVLAVFAIMRRISVGFALPFLAGLCFLCLPAVIDLSHEAKPHLAGTALMLLAILAASKYIETGKWKWIIWTAIACGACAGMVLSGLMSLAILPLMAVIRPQGVGRFVAVCIIGGTIAAALYFITNPYVAIHLAGDRSILQANFANTRAMYSSDSGNLNLGHAFQLLLVAASVPAAIFGALGFIAALCSKRSSPMHGLGWLLGIVALLVALQFGALADNKPGEYARFGLFVAVVLMLAAFIGIGRVPLYAAQVALGIIVIAFVAFHSAAYERGFIADSLADNSRMRAGSTIDQRLASAGPTPVLYVTSEPAPYCLPPVNLVRWRMILLPADGVVPPGSPAGILVKPNQDLHVFDPNATPMSWANMQFDVADVGGK